MILKYTVFVFREPSERAVFCIGRHARLRGLTKVGLLFIQEVVHISRQALAVHSDPVLGYGLWIWYRQ